MATTFHVRIKPCEDPFPQTYMQGCEQLFYTLEEAEAYFQSFEDWEQMMLYIDIFDPCN